MTQHTFDIVVIGGGHAAIEAAWAAAHIGLRTAMVTLSVPNIGRMSCNPAIGGLGKGQIVREIDAMGGLMGLAADATGIQFRMLNRGKGPAVWAPRCQSDLRAYVRYVSQTLANTPNLTILQGEAIDVATTDSPRPSVTGVVLADGRTLRTTATIVATGTFLGGRIHCGAEQFPGGRIGEPPATQLTGALTHRGLTFGRLKTGTPPRVHRDSVDFDRLQPQPGDDDPQPFSFMTDRLDLRQVPCWITHTSTTTHDLIRANFHRAPLFSGQIQSTGPRYCPSIEDKVHRFADRDSHQIFLEPEGIESERIYCNGISTSLPIDVQQPMVQSIAGLERAQILQYGYAIEYDYAPPDQLHATLETKAIAGLFLAGQINGTSGYEEAAGQGLIAGINATRLLANREPITLGRDQAYIGVMIDDLVTRPPTEPYRMFTSRAEYRLHLRADNADQRLTELGRSVGLVDDARWTAHQGKLAAIADARQFLDTHRRDGKPLADWLRRPDTTWRDLLDDPAPLNRAALDQIQIEIRYDGYLQRERRQIERVAELEQRPIPAALNYDTVPHLRIEARQKLIAIAPRNLGQASRIPGVTPADITVLLVYLEKR